MITFLKQIYWRKFISRLSECICLSGISFLLRNLRRHLCGRAISPTWDSSPWSNFPPFSYMASSSADRCLRCVYLRRPRVFAFMHWSVSLTKEQMEKTKFRRRGSGPWGVVSTNCPITFSRISEAISSTCTQQSFLNNFELRTGQETVLCDVKWG